jgi:hypothetical protein
MLRLTELHFIHRKQDSKSEQNYRTSELNYNYELDNLYVTILLSVQHILATY